jgi:hypothetical protein
MYKIRVTAEVLETVHATRRVNVDGRVLTFGRGAGLPPGRRVAPAARR